MTYDTSTPEGRAKRLAELGGGYKWHTLRDAFNLSNSDRDVDEADAGEPPKGANWN